MERFTSTVPLYYSRALTTSLIVFESLPAPTRVPIIYIRARGGKFSGFYHTVILTSTPEGNSNFINESMVLGVVL